MTCSPVCTVIWSTGGCRPRRACLVRASQWLRRCWEGHLVAAFLGAPASLRTRSTFPRCGRLDPNLFVAATVWQPRAVSHRIAVATASRFSAESGDPAVLTERFRRMTAVSETASVCSYGLGQASHASGLLVLGMVVSTRGVCSGTWNGGRNSSISQAAIQF